LTLVALALAFSFLPASAYAQVPLGFGGGLGFPGNGFGININGVNPAATSPNACGNLIARTMFPTLAAANTFSPAGVWPVGHAPLNQPFATDPTNFATYGYPQLAYMVGYAIPSTMGGPPDPSLTASAILQTAQSNGAMDAMAPDQQVNLMIQLAQLQNTETSNRIQQAAVRQNAAVDMVNIARVPYDLAHQNQDSSRNWRESWSIYAGTALLPTLTAICPTNPTAGPAAGAPFTSTAQCVALRIC
jgi:hypothetical protein